jgi:hypothetical protein
MAVTTALILMSAQRDTQEWVQKSTKQEPAGALVAYLSRSAYWQAANHMVGTARKLFKPNQLCLDHVAHELASLVNQSVNALVNLPL